MKTLLFIFTFLITTQLFAQHKRPEDFGYRHLQTLYKGDTVDILIQTKPGDENKIKPIFFFCQGSLPVPLIVLDGKKIFRPFSFTADSLIEKYHVVIVSKPFVPLIVEANRLGNNFVYQDRRTGKIPKKYSDRNLLDYYVDRNVQVIDFLQKQSFVSRDKLIIAGHSEGSTVASKLALINSKVTHLIYASGCPFGRIMAIIGQERANETDTDSTRYAEAKFIRWEKIVNDRTNMDDSQGDTYKANYDFSIPPIEYLRQLKIPVLVCYGTKDWAAPFNDYLRVEMLRQKKKNFTYNAYIGLEHNFFPVTPTGQPDYDKFNWDKVVLDWQKWLGKN